MQKPRFQWTGVFRIYNAETGELVYWNEILADGIELTLALWAGDTDEAFGSFRLLDAGDNEIALVDVDITYEVDESGSAPRGELTSRALVSGSTVSSAIAAVELVGTQSTVIARATVSLDAGQAYEIKRTDYLAEAASVAPE